MCCLYVNVRAPAHMYFNFTLRKNHKPLICICIDLGILIHIVINCKSFYQERFVVEQISKARVKQYNLCIFQIIHLCFTHLYLHTVRI